MKPDKDEDFLGLCLLLPKRLDASPLRKYLDPGLPIQSYTSQLHHPTAILLVRTRVSPKLKNPEFAARTERTVVILLDKEELVHENAEADLEPFLDRYRRIGANVTVFFQRAEEVLSEQEFACAVNRLTRERIDEWGIHLLLSGVTVFETENERDSAKMIGRLAHCILAGAESAISTGYEEAAERVEGGDLWTNFLINIPGVSQAKAEKIKQKYPSLDTLMQEYIRTDRGHISKLELLEDLGDGQRHKKLSSRICHMLTSLDPRTPFLV